jgi:hypothetical protein
MPRLRIATAALSILFFSACSGSSGGSDAQDGGAGSGGAGSTGSAGLDGDAGGSTGRGGTSGGSAGQDGGGGTTGAAGYDGGPGSAGQDGGAGTTGAAGHDGGAGTTGVGGHDGGAGAGGATDGGHGDGPTDGADAVSFSTVQPILMTSCVRCHDPAHPIVPETQTFVAMDLTAKGAYAALVGKPATETCGGTLVTPGNPGKSYLYAKITQDTPCAGERMPHQGMTRTPPLPADQIAKIESWIRGGATP